ncbi:hypothetical protein [Bacillus wiedmannii]|nr:hypothetical protein [Bacillus wiedmannii]
MMTTFLTILTGVFVFIIGRFIEKLFIDPMKEHKTVIAEIYDGLMYLANKIGHPLELTENTDEDKLKEYREASNELRKMSTKLRAATFNLQGAYWFYRFLFKAPTIDDINVVCASLIKLSNSITYVKGAKNFERNLGFQREILEKLKLSEFEEKALKKTP